MEREHLWQNINTTAMADVNFDPSFQQQGFNPQFLPSLDNPILSNELSLSYSSLPTQFGADHGGQPEAPDVKLGLKAMITTKYKENGTDIPRVELKGPEPPKPKVKEENPEVLKKRRERNKIAATKCRRRKRERIEKLEKRINEIRAKMRLLQEEKAQLQKEYQSLRDCLINHTCKLPQVLVPTSTDCTTDSKFLTLYTQTFGNFNYDAF